ncbi:MAG: bifunctional aconitate hydratase 2/2-methylisocitrate dehydratase [Alphaproteobacteria bacterium]|nr:bifunctional aconitate hydratase 2/2-methylisocitrate dehydratase [Alphaproteobacteria bacterium]
MSSVDIIKDYYKSYEDARVFDEKHPEDGTLSRKDDGLPMRPMNVDETNACIDVILSNVSKEKKDEAVDLLFHNVQAGINEAADAKALFLEKVANGSIKCESINPIKAVEILSTMVGGKCIPCLIRLLETKEVASKVCQLLSNMVLVYDNIKLVDEISKKNNEYALNLLENWAKASWFANKPELKEFEDFIVYKIPDDIEASTDFLSHSKGGHTRTDVPFHAKHYFMNKDMLNELNELKTNNPDCPVCLVADKIGTSSSRKSGMNNVEWNIGLETDETKFQPNKKTRAVIIAGSVLGPIFAKTAQDMGSAIIRSNTNAFNTGDKIRVFWNKGLITDLNNKKISEFDNFGKKELDILKAGGATVFRMGKILTNAASNILNKKFDLPWNKKDEDTNDIPMSSSLKVIAKAAGLKSLKSGDVVYCKVGTVASQDTTGPMTLQEIQTTLAVDKFSVPLFLQSQCHNAAMGFRTENVVKANSNLANTVKKFGGVALNMGDGIIHSWLNELVVPDSIVVGGDSHTRVPTALSFPLGSGGIAEASATGVTEIEIPEVVRVVIKGEFNKGITVRDLVNYIPYKALKKFGHNIFEGSIIEYYRDGKPFEMIDVFKLTNSSAERSAAASYFEMSSDEQINYLKNYIVNSSLPIIKKMIEDGYDNNNSLKNRVKDLEDWCNNPIKFKSDDNAKYKEVIEIDLSEIKEPYIACPHTPDNVKSLSELNNEAPNNSVEFGFVGSCMSAEKDFVSFRNILKEKQIKVPLWAAIPTKFVEAKLVCEGVVEDLKNIGIRIEVPGCSLCMGNQERVFGKKNVLTTSTRNFKARMGDEASVYLVSAELEAVSALLGRFPSVKEYFDYVLG